MDKEQRDRLLTMTETDAGNLPREEWHLRVRLLREKIGMDALKNNYPNLAYQKEKKISPRSSSEHLRLVDDWHDKS
jgi:hypothetical protein